VRLTAMLLLMFVRCSAPELNDPFSMRPSPSDGDKLDGDSHVDLGDDASVGDRSGVQGLAGVWARLQVLVSTGQHIFGEVTTTVTSTERLVIDEGDNGYVLSATPCAVAIENTPGVGVRSIISDAYLEALGTKVSGAEVVGGYYHEALAIELQGVNLADPANDELPDDPLDERVIDQDEDGHPGMTVFLTGIVSGELYVIQRTFTELAGTVDVETGTGLGSITWSSQQRTLGSTPATLAQFAPDDGTPSAAESVFRMRRVESNTDCPTIVANADQWF